MKGKVVGCSLKKCDEGKKWETSATVYLQTEFNEGLLVSEGFCVRTYVCEGRRLPASPKEMIGHQYAICTNNNFISEFIPLD